MKKIIVWLCFIICLSGCSKNRNYSSSVKTCDFEEQLVSKRPERIVCLSPSGAEILCALGEYKSIAGRSSFCDFPSEMSNVEIVGGFDGNSVSIEKIVSMNADFVYASAGMHENLIKPLEEAGIKIYLSSADSIEAIYSEIYEIGSLLRRKEEASYVIENIKRKLDVISQLNKNKENPLVYWEVWNSPYMSAGKNSFINDLIIAAGGKNIFGNLGEAYPIVSEEAILTLNPDVIIVPDTFLNAEQMIKARNGWAGISAVKNDKILVLNADVISRPGPRIVEAVQTISDGIH